MNFNSKFELSSILHEKMVIRAREIEKFKNIELERGIFDEHYSFHSEFHDCPWIIIRNLSYQLSEGDICTIFEQYGTITAMELVRDDKTGAPRGTCIICYEDPRSAILAVDNLNGISVLGRTIAVDHTKYVENQKSKLTDPRTMTPARLRISGSDVAKPIFDHGSASSTESEIESNSYSESESEQ